MSEPTKLSSKQQALDALQNALDQVARPVMSPGALRALIAEAMGHVQSIDELKVARRANKATHPTKETT